MYQQSQSSTPSSLHIKRSQFHDSIRRQQLDAYRRKKRLQLFGFSMNNVEGNQNHLDKNLHQEKKKIEMFLLQMWAERLGKENYHFDAINEVSKELEKMDLVKLTNVTAYDKNEFQSTVMLLTSMVEAWLNHVQKNPSTINLPSNISFTLIKNLQQLFTGIIHEQDYIESQMNTNKKRKIYYKKVLERKDQQPRNVDLKKIQQTLKEIEEKQCLVKHPLERCWGEIRKIVQMIGEVTVLLSTLSTNENDNFNHAGSSPTLLLTQCEQLYTIISLISHPLYTCDLLSLYIDRLYSLQYIPEPIIQKIIETLYNFVTLQTMNPRNKQISNSSIIKYDIKTHITITKLFAMILQKFPITMDALNKIVKSLNHMFLVHQQAYMPIFIDSGIIKNILQPFVTQRQQCLNLWKGLQKKLVSENEFIQKYEQFRISYKQKIDMLQLVGAVFNYVQSSKYFVEIVGLLPIVQELLHYEMRELGKSNQAKMSVFKDCQQLFSQKISISQQQDIIQYTLFVLRNMLGVAMEVCKGFIEKHGINDLLVVWQHMCWLEEMVEKDTTGSYTKQKLQQSRRTKIILIDCLYNITSILASENGDRQALSTFLEYKHSAVMKLLLHHLKSYRINEDLLYHADHKDSMRYSLSTLQKLLAFVIIDGYSLKLVDDLEHSGGEFGAEMMREMLTVIMMGEDTYGNNVSELAGKCLELVDVVLKQFSLEGGQYGGQQLRHQQYFMNSYENNNNNNQNQQFEI